MRKPRPRGTPLDRFNAKWEPEPNTGCWLWTAATYGLGYGAFAASGARVRRAHRVAWEFFRGPIPAGMNVNHRCDQRLCVNPDHLWVGTQLENMRDMHAKGRAVCHGAILTADAVREIRSTPDATGRSFARKYGVSDATISGVRRGKRWRQVA